MSFKSYRDFYSSEFFSGLLFGTGAGCMFGYFLLNGLSANAVAFIAIALEIIGGIILKRRNTVGIPSDIK
jgi:hypothetical protein